MQAKIQERHVTYKRWAYAQLGSAEVLRAQLGKAVAQSKLINTALTEVVVTERMW